MKYKTRNTEVEAIQYNGDMEAFKIIEWMSANKTIGAEKVCIERHSLQIHLSSLYEAFHDLLITLKEGDWLVIIGNRTRENGDALSVHKFTNSEFERLFEEVEK